MLEVAAAAQHVPCSALPSAGDLSLLRQREITGCPAPALLFPSNQASLVLFLEGRGGGVGVDSCEARGRQSKRPQGAQSGAELHGRLGIERNRPCSGRCETACGVTQGMNTCNYYAGMTMATFGC